MKNQSQSEGIEAQENQSAMQHASMFQSIKKRFSVRMEKASENPQLVNTTIANRLPQLMFLLVPVFALFLKLFYVRSDQFYVQHLVFALHFHSFTFLILNVILWSYLISQQPFGLVLMFALPIYLFFSLKRVYNQSARKTCSKLLVLLGSYFVVVTISMVAVVMVTIFMYA
ncbi:hypothetical protein GWO43_07320 [candidate division KSB1 bacterium]|nr:hypothetical protein [candidate division KSB1 bacterium]NIX70376.1 hypothetical protein [candidate division KSB1 bacterium]